jgi:long-chain acyl-CoA synthetase/malonyl-CoA/methylmalonyl-CoA synthetase
LLLWFGAWRIGAVVCPLNIEINEKLLAGLAPVVNPALVLYHKDLPIDALVGDCKAPRARFGAWSREGAADPADECFSTLSRGHGAAEVPERNEADDLACIFCTSGTTSRPKIVVYDHCAYWLNGLSTLECLGLTADDHTLEYRSFGWNSAQVLSLMPFLEKGLTMHIAKRFSRGRRADRAQHAVAQAARLHRERPADPAPDELFDRAAHPRAMAAVRGDVRRQAAADVRHV